MHPTIEKWLTLSRQDLDDVYRNVKPGPIPLGDTKGTAIATGKNAPMFWAKPFASVTEKLAWQGKVFDLLSAEHDCGVLVNKVLPFGLPLLVAKVYREKSWLDGKETIVLDYGKTSLLAQKIRDEIREVEPNLYLGKVWWGQTRVIDFALETYCQAERRKKPTKAKAAAAGSVEGKIERVA